MITFASLRAKLYAYEIDKNETLIECKRAKGVKNCVVKKKIKFQDYVECFTKRK